MANINPLNRFRKYDSSRPLHARWGDVAITAPTEGSWCQYDNANSAPKRRGYGPGYVPEGRPRVLPSRPKRREDHEEDDDDDEEGSTSLSQRSSSSINSLNPRRLSMLLSRPKPVEGSGGGRRQRDIESGVDFAYKPIKHDYSTEVAEISHNRTSRFRYIPASPRYGELEAIGPRSQSASPYDPASRVERADGPRRHLGHSALRYEDDIDDDYDEEDWDRRAHRASVYSKRVLGSSAEKKKRYSSRRMTTVMVPDAEDIYG